MGPEKVLSVAIMLKFPGIVSQYFGIVSMMMLLFLICLINLTAAMRTRIKMCAAAHMADAADGAAGDPAADEADAADGAEGARVRLRRVWPQLHHPSGVGYVRLSQPKRLLSIYPSIYLQAFRAGAPIWEVLGLLGQWL